MKNNEIKTEANKFIDRCKFSCYETYDAGNEAEGDYGTWENWRDILFEFSCHIKRLEKEENSGKDNQIIAS
jgi:hypothetical protein